MDMIPENLPLTGAAGILAYKLLGPPAGTMGQYLSHAVDYSVENVTRVIEKATRKVDPEDLEEEALASPRAIKSVVDEASFSEDEVVAEYLGGVLASSRTSDGTDDSAVTWSALVGRLSSMQLRLHYALYVSLMDRIRGSDINLGLDTERKQLTSFIPFRELLPALELTPREFGGAFGEAFDGLHAEDLVDDRYMHGAPSDELHKMAPGITEPGLAWGPTVRGLRLLLWGLGHGTKHPNALRDPDLRWEFESDIRWPSDVLFVDDLKAAEKERTKAEREEKRQERNEQKRAAKAEPKDK